MLASYYHLVKPGEVYGNSITAIAGFLVGASGKIHFAAFLALVVGLGLVMAGCLVINNWIDRDIDAKMERTRDRALASGKISAQAALTFAALLLALGFYLLSFTNLLTMAVAAVGLIDYVVLYSLAKRRTAWSTVIGSVSGAVPIMAGYTAATGRLDAGAWLLFAAMTFWQMPHFYSIGIFRRDEYAAAGLPVLPVKVGAARARLHILWYMAAYLITVLLLGYFGITGWLFAALIGAATLAWLWQGLSFHPPDLAVWARRIFGQSLIVLMLFSLLISVGSFIH